MSDTRNPYLQFGVIGGVNPPGPSGQSPLGAVDPVWDQSASQPDPGKGDFAPTTTPPPINPLPKYPFGNLRSR